MLVSGRGLLEWNPSGEADRGEPDGPCRAPVETCGSRRSSPCAAAGYLLYSRPVALPAAVPILSLWFVSPLITWWISKPLSPPQSTADRGPDRFPEEAFPQDLGLFEAFVGPDDHWLPPDNYQEEPVAAVAHRTSPTNMGLALLSNLSACDFGYISVGQFIERTAKALRTMEALERHRGHFYNWYDTESLQAPAAHVCFVGGQRKSGRKPSHLAGGIARAPRRESCWEHGCLTVLGHGYGSRGCRRHTASLPPSPRLKKDLESANAFPPETLMSVTE